jgi:uracil-DNA glycosylase family 4
VNSELQRLHTEIDSCVRCRGDGQNIIKPAAMDRGSGGAGIMAIGIAPGRAAVGSGLAFAGNSISRLIQWFTAAGFPMTEQQCRAAIYFTSLNKCGVTPDTAANRRSLWARCNAFLWRQIECLKPQLVLILGQEPGAMILRSVGNYASVVGRSWTTSEIFREELFPATTWETRWLLLPHPSGLSRTMNDPATRERVLAALRAHLLAINFAAEKGEP